MTLNRVSLQSWRSRQLFLWRPAWGHHPHGYWRPIWQYAWLHDPPTAEEAQGAWRCAPGRLSLNVHAKLIWSSCFHCPLEEHKLWEHPADCPEHRRAGPRPGLRPQLHVSFCTFRMRQWAECTRWASPFSWAWRQLNLCPRRCWISARRAKCQLFLQQATT